MPNYDPTIWDQLFGYTDNQGNNFNGKAVPILQGLSGLGQSWLGFQQLGLAKDQFNFKKDFSIQQYNQQASDINRQLADRQRARVAAAPSAYQSVGDYMGANKVKDYNG